MEVVAPANSTPKSLAYLSNAAKIAAVLQIPGIQGDILAVRAAAGADPVAWASDRYKCAKDNVVDQLDATRKVRLLAKQVRFFYGATRYVKWVVDPSTEINMEQAIRQQRHLFSTRLRKLCVTFCDASTCGSIRGSIEAL